MSAVALLRASTWSRRVRRRPQPVTWSGKDFGTVPVCGSVRPLASQRARR